NVKSDRFDRGPFCAHLDAERVGEAVVTWLLPPVIGLNPVSRDLECGDRIFITGFFGGVDLRGGHAQSDLCKIDTIKPGGQLEQRTVAARHDIRNDAANGFLDVLCGLAFERKQTPKSVREIRALTVQTKGHDLILPGRPGRQGQWLMRVLASTLGVTYMLNQARFDFGVPSLTSAWAGQRP